MLIVGKQKITQIKLFYILLRPTLVSSSSWQFTQLKKNNVSRKNADYHCSPKLVGIQCSRSTSVTLYSPTDSHHKGKLGFAFHVVVGILPGLTLQTQQVLLTRTVLAHVLLSALEDDALLHMLLLRTQIAHIKSKVSRSADGGSLKLVKQRQLSAFRKEIKIHNGLKYH